MRFSYRPVGRPIFWLAIAFMVVMALVPDPPRLPWELSDRVQHIIAFLVLTALATTAYSKVRLLWIAIALSALGAVIELAQMIPALHRDAQLLDWVADTGAIAAIALLIRLYRLQNR